jgi:kinesin family protein 6/9
MASRSTIGYLKKTIEALRRERALANEGLLGDDDHHQGSESGDGYYGGTDSASAAEGSGTGGGGGVGASEEAEAMAKMEREKAIYATCCGNLRDEKAAIEHIQKLMEQGRSKLQSEFDEWYGHCLTAEARHTVRGTHPAPHTATAANNTAASANAAASPGAHHHHGHSAAAAAAPSNEARVSMAAPKPVPENSHGGGGVELTGNKAADDDILAFERAKEELYLLQRRQAQQR